MAKGLREGSRKEQALDKKEAAKRGLTMKQYEGSKADIRQDKRDKVKPKHKGRG